MAAITGAAGADRLVGTGLDDAIDGLGGGDQLFGLGGDDSLTGGEGDDRLDGGTGADAMAGGAGDDAYYVDAAGDTITELSGEGRDTATASVSYMLAAGAAVERLIAAPGLLSIDLTGNELANQIFGNDGANVLTGGGGGDNLYGKGGDDTLTGGDLRDVLDGGTGADAMAGGAGNDVYVVDDAGDTVTEAVGEGTDRVQSTVTYALAADVAIEQFYSTGNAAVDLTGSDTANTIVANNAANTLSGLGGNDRLNGRGGIDTLFGGEGDDALIGGTGADAMSGGKGNDTYYIDDAGDTVAELAGEGSDRALVGVNWTLGAGQAVELLVARGGTAIDITGNELANQIYGNKAANVLDGGGGADTLVGGAGDDTYHVDYYFDVVIEAVGGGDDELITSASFILSSGQEVERLTAGVDTNIGLFGNEFANIITTGAGADILDGRAGADTLIGGAGNDAYYVDDLGDQVTEDANAGIDSVFSTATWTLGDNVENLYLDGTDAIDGTGNALANIIRGNSAANVLSGGDGDDLLYVGTGDTAIGGNGADQFRVTGGGSGTVRVIGEAGDRVFTNDTGWQAAGTVVLDGVLVNRFVNGNVTLLVDAAVDTVNVQTAPAFGATVTTAGFDRQVIDLTTLSPDRGFIIQGDAAYDFTGRSVSSAGDINGDGFADLIVGANEGDDAGYNSGEAYVVFGGAGSFGSADGTGRRVIDLTTLTASQGFVIQGDAVEDHTGWGVSSAGDVNGDGIADIIVGAPFGDDGGGNAGEAYVVFGTAAGFGSDVGGRQVLDLATLSASQGFIIQGDGGFDTFGYAVAGAGDVNGDGIADMIAGARWGDDGGLSAGEAYVVFGTAAGFGSDVGGRQVIDLTSLSAAEGFIIQGDAAQDHAGISVSSAGDVNGDGFADLIVGAYLGDDGGTDAGEAYVVFGGTSGFGSDVGGRQVIDLTSLSAAEGFVIQGDAAGDEAGRSVSSAGDVNGDGIADLIVGAPKGEDAGGSAGEAYVVFGRTGGFGTNVGGRQVVDLTSLSAAEGFVIQADASGDRTGISVSSAGDVNGDGFVDLIVGAFSGDDGGSNAGEAYVVFGRAGGFGVDVGGRQVLDLTSLSAADGFIVQGDATGDRAGTSVSSAGDINGDGFADLLMSAYRGADGGTNAGEAYVIFGGPAGFALPQLAGSTAGNDTLAGTAAAERLIGGRGDDTLTGNGGADVFVGGAGDDVIDVGSGNFFRIDGGLGSDRLVTGASLDFTLLDDVMVRGIETIEVTGGGAQSLAFDAHDVLAIGAANRNVLGTAHDNVLVLAGDGADTLHLTGLADTGADAVFGGQTYSLYALAGHVVLAVDTDFVLV